MADVNTATVFYRKTSGNGAPQVQTLSTLKTDLGLTGTNSGDQTITLTGDVTGSGTGSFAATIGDGKVTNAMLAGNIDLTSKVTGSLPVTNGGTGRNTTTTAYGIITAGALTTAAHNTLAAGLTNQILVGGGATGYPVWTTASGTDAPVRANSPTLTTPRFTDLGYIADINSNVLLKFNLVPGAVNYITIKNSITAAAPAIRANGDDLDVNLTLESKGDGDVLVTNGSFGYGAGGGTVTQSTSITTSVTLNKSCGQITLFSDDRTLNTNNQFILNNTKISANDVVVVSFKTQGVSDGIYGAQVVETTNGTCTINIHCFDSPVSNESPVLNFVVIKAVAS